MARQKHLQVACGDLGRASVAVSKYDSVIYQIRCRKCVGRDATTYRSGHPNSYMDAVSRWNAHILHVHPDLPAPPSLKIEADAIAHGYVYESVAQRKSALLKGS